MMKPIILGRRSNRPMRASIVLVGPRCIKSARSTNAVGNLQPIKFAFMQAPRYGLSCNYFSSSAGADDKKDEPDAETFLTKWIKSFNEIATQHPEASLYSFLIMRISTWYMLAGAAGLLLDIGPELAVGYVAARFTGNFRQPFNAGLAGLISYEYPIFSTIKASALMGIIKEAPSKVEKPPQVVKFENFIKWISGPIDKYGFSYFVASRINLALVVLGISYGVQTGLDVPEMLTYMGVSEAAMKGAGTMGFATLANVILTPVHLAVFPILLPHVINQKNRLGQSIEIMQNMYDKKSKDK